MPISSLVLTVAVPPAVESKLLARLERDERFTLGERNGNKVPVVIDAKSREEERRLLEELLHDDCVVNLDVVFNEVTEQEGDA